MDASFQFLSVKASVLMYYNCWRRATSAVLFDRRK